MEGKGEGKGGEEGEGEGVMEYSIQRKYTEQDESRKPHRCTKKHLQMKTA